MKKILISMILILTSHTAIAQTITSTVTSVYTEGGSHRFTLHDDDGCLTGTAIEFLFATNSTGPNFNAELQASYAVLLSSFHAQTPVEIEPQANQCFDPTRTYVRINWIKAVLVDQ